MESKNLINASIAELLVAIEATKRKFNVYFPFSGSNKCDLIIEKNGILKRIQVKKIWKNKRGNRICQATSQSYNRRSRQSYIPYSNKEIDILMAVDIDNSDIWIIPVFG